mgnify:CR=1 FL=1
MYIQEAIAPYAGQPLTQQLLLDILRDYKRPYDKITELVKQNRLIQVKRGLYIPGEKLKLQPPVSFLLAIICTGQAMSPWILHFPFTGSSRRGYLRSVQLH